MTTTEINDVLSLPIKQRILLVEKVWDSIRPASNEVPVPNSHKQELDRRFKKYKQDPSALLTDQQLKKAIDLRK